MFRKSTSTPPDDDLEVRIEGNDVDGYTGAVYDGEFRLYVLRCNTAVKDRYGYKHKQKTPKFSSHKEIIKAGKAALAKERAERAAVLVEKERRERTRTEKTFRK